VQLKNYTCQKLKLDILTNGRLFSLSKSPEEGGTYFENTKNMAKWREEDLADLNKPVDKTRCTNSECVL
jgi:hypothetical protein